MPEYLGEAIRLLGAIPKNKQKISVKKNNGTMLHIL